METTKTMQVYSDRMDILSSYTSQKPYNMFVVFWSMKFSGNKSEII